MTLETLHEVAEGPYYKKGSPERVSIAEIGTAGDKLTLEGRVLDKSGNGIPGAWIDFWQADGNGDYDNSNYNLRGHQYSETDGRYRLETVRPGAYEARTPHIHVKVRARADATVVTTQLFFPGEERNDTDPLFDSALLLELHNGSNSSNATFDFVLDTG